MQQTLADANRLFLEGQIALAQVEDAGMAIDTEYLERAIVDVSARIKAMQEDMRADPVYRIWKRRFGEKTNISSRQQLADVLFKDMKFEPLKTTEKSSEDDPRYATGKDSLVGIDIPFVRNFVDVAELIKLRGTHLYGIRNETVDGLLHPVFNLNLVKTGRSSGDTPNFQNINKRNPKLAEIVRRCIVPRKDHVIAEIDYSGIEVCIAACYHKDPTMLAYIEDPKSDMHRDMSCQIFFLEENQVTDQVRDCVKQAFVFAQFYGDYYVNSAKNLWNYIKNLKLKTADGVGMRTHLKKHGTADYVDFEDHLKAVEKDFWGTRFPVYDQWRKDFYAEYQAKGYFDSFVGFRCNALSGQSGFCSKNDVTNYPVQGCLAGSSRVLTQESGWVPIKDLVGTVSEVWTGLKWATGVGIDMGESRRAVVTLSSGLKMRCDIRHKFKNEMDEWIPFDDLKIGNWVALPNNGRIVEASQDMNWWFVFGFIVGDGCLHSRRDCMAIVVGQKKREVLLRIKEFLIGQGYEDGGYGGVHLDTVPASGNRKEKYKLVLENKRFAAFLKSNGFDFSWKSHTKRVPDSVWEAPQQCQRDFLEGLWLSDGCRGEDSKYNLHMAGMGLLRDVQRLSGCLGFDSILTGNWLRFHWKEFNAKSPRKYPATAILRLVKSVNKTNYENANEYITDNRAFSQVKKGVNISQYIAERLIERNTREGEIYRYDTVESIVLLDKVENTYTMSVDDPLHQYVADGVIQKNCAFHCLLWSLIRVQRWLVKRQMRTKIVGQIHDALVMDVHRDELQEVLTKAKKIMTADLKKAWEWIITPMTVKVDIGEKNWHDKQKWIENKEGVWGPK